MYSLWGIVTTCVHKMRVKIHKQYTTCLTIQIRDSLKCLKCGLSISNTWLFVFYSVYLLPPAWTWSEKENDREREREIVWKLIVRFETIHTHPLSHTHTHTHTHTHYVVCINDHLAYTHTDGEGRVCVCVEHHCQIWTCNIVSVCMKNISLFLCDTDTHTHTWYWYREHTKCMLLFYTLIFCR